MEDPLCDDKCGRVGTTGARAPDNSIGKGVGPGSTVASIVSTPFIITIYQNVTLLFMGRLASLLDTRQGTSWLNLRGWFVGLEKRLHVTFGAEDPASHAIPCAVEEPPSSVGHADNEFVVRIQGWRVVVDAKTSRPECTALLMGSREPRHHTMTGAND